MVSLTLFHSRLNSQLHNIQANNERNGYEKYFSSPVDMKNTSKSSGTYELSNENYGSVSKPEIRWNSIFSLNPKDLRAYYIQLKGFQKMGKG
mmetsp:Transcript_38432/g.64459  ORF Transcript_38432/g.64459 Transcript_38432/m.64459 type:complete len:92 (+) Transcript_38432:1622-1897(+)